MQMQEMKLALCICTMYQIISHIIADESNESKTNEDNFSIRLVSLNNTRRKVDSSQISASAENDFIVKLVAKNETKIKEEDKQYEAEKKLGDMANLFGNNQHYSYPETYKDLNRRFVPQYPYKEVLENNNEILKNNPIGNDLKPIKAPPEVVLAVAARGAFIEASNRHNQEDESINKNILRSGNYWNGVWREDVDPAILRTQTEKVVEPIKVKVMPESKLYKLVSELKKISPRLLYVIKRK